MNKEEILRTLRAYAPELRQAGLMHLHLFGSAARGQANTQSDIDLMAEFDSSQKLTLLTIASLEGRLSVLLGTKVDLSSAAWMRDPVREQALQESVLAF